MSTKKYKPTTPSMRRKETIKFDHLTPDVKPEKSLLRKKTSSGGRNNKGRITSRHRGGGTKKRYRVIDFKRDKHGIPARVKTVEYDPNRSANIMLLAYADGEKRYIIAPLGVKPGDILMSGPMAEVKPGNAMPLEKMPVGSRIHNLEFKPGKGAQLVRSAGAVAQIVSRESNRVLVRLPSGEIRAFPRKVYATLGQIANLDHSNVNLGKAGAMRRKGKRPSVRGIAMNPIDHPHGGGEGRVKGYKQAVTPWGQPCKGYKTRRGKNKSDKLIIKRRKK